MYKVLVVLMMTPWFVSAQFSVLSESFDDYAIGDLVSTVGASNNWGLWTGLDAESCVVSGDEFVSELNSGYVVDDGTTSTRATWTWSDYNEGKYSFSASVLVPEESTGGFIGFHDSLGLEMPHSISLLGDSTMLFLDWEAFSYLEVTGMTPGWHTILVTFDLDNLSSEFIVDGVSAGIMSTSFGVTSGFGGVEFGAYAYNPFTGQQPPGAYYIDDLNLVDELSTIGLETLNSSKLTVLPNPSNGSFTIDISTAEFTRAKLTLTDMTGTVVYSNIISNTGSLHSIDTLLASGMYILSLKDAEQQWSEKIIIK